MIKFTFRGIDFSIKDIEKFEIKDIKVLLKKKKLRSILLKSKKVNRYINNLNSLKVVSFDPGKKNFAFAIISKNNISTGMLNNLITTLNDPVIFNKQVRNFSIEIKKLVNKTDYIIIERFLARGRFGGFIAECLNIMIGIISYIYKEKIILITAAQHKNFFKKLYNIKTKNFQNKIIKGKLLPHEKDAIMIGLYFLYTKGYSKSYLMRIIKKFNREIV